MAGSAVVAAEVGAPFEQTQFDRGISTRNDNASSGSSAATGVGASDYHFVSPAQ